MTGASRAGPVLAHAGPRVIQDVVRARNGYDLTWWGYPDCLSDEESWDSSILWLFGDRILI